MIPFIAASGLIALGLPTWRDSTARSWMFITYRFIIALDEALEGLAKRHLKSSIPVRAGKYPACD